MAADSRWFFIMAFFRRFIDFIRLIIVVLYHILKSCYGWIVPAEYKSIRNDIVLVTGGGKGLGKRLVIEFAKRQPKHIVICGKDEQPLNDVAEMINAHGVACTPLVCDVSDRENIYAMAERIKKTIGDVTILVNNAGVVYGLPIVESKDEETSNAIDVNTLAHIWTLKAFLPSMLKSNHGHVVAINSVVGLIGLPGAAEYCASKYASVAAMESLDLLFQELRCTGVKVTVVHPFQIKNKMFEGCSTRFPRIFPALEETYVAQRTLHAVLSNQRQVILPRLMYLVCWSNTWLPTEVTMAIMRFTGAAVSMKNFYRRHFHNQLPRHESSNQSDNQ